MVTPAESDEQIAECFGVYVQLRPHLRDAADLVERVRRQMADGFRLITVRRNGRVAAVAGYRVSENLAWGKFLYVDDLVTDAGTRSTGCGRELLDWLIVEARQLNCRQLHLDSGVQRFAAHRFYLRERMDITSHHFARVLD
ncbi:MAG: GNAT family N-acetyltransferase [Gemmataceae bacterium]|nr:GNAT family N-acetyltransferase [Gemmataceae bacterium]